MRLFIIPVFFMTMLFLSYRNGPGKADAKPPVKSLTGESDLQKSTPPNIVLIMADDMGFSDIGCYGGEINTPNLDRLAKQGIRFTRMYNNAFCSPTRASLLTGLFPVEAGMGELAGPRIRPKGPFQGYLNDSCVTVAEVLKQAGYYTALSGKWHLGEYKPHWPMNRGFDTYFGLISGAANYFNIKKTKSASLIRYMALDNNLYIPPDHGFYMTDAIADHAVEMLDQHQDNKQPLFLYVAFTAPHWPLHAMPEDIARYKGKYRKGWGSLRQERYNRQLSIGIFDNSVKLSQRDPEVHAWEELTSRQQEELDMKMAVYAAQIDRMDQGIGRILDKIEKSDKADNTLVIFLSDNGGCAEDGLYGFDLRNNELQPGGEDSYMSYGQSWANASNTPFRNYKKSLYEGGISTPFIVRWPAGIDNKRAATFTPQVGHVVDLMPTLCELTGATYPGSFNGTKLRPLQGQSLASTICNGDVQPHRPIYWLLQGQRAIMKDDYKLVSGRGGTPWELYNLRKDRSETKDLSRSDPRRVREMSEAWEQWGNRYFFKP